MDVVDCPNVAEMKTKIGCQCCCAVAILSSRVQHYLMRDVMNIEVLAKSSRQ